VLVAPEYTKAGTSFGSVNVFTHSVVLLHTIDAFGSLFNHTK
jgi:hypothetical protein